METHPEKTPKDTGQDAQAHSREPRAQSAAGPGCTVRGAAAQRRDSLEETLRELEATLSQMGTALSAGTPGSPPPLPPSPQVAASSPSSSSCLCAPVSWSSELEGAGGLQVHLASLLLPMAFSQLLPASWELGAGWGLQAEPREAGKLAYPGISPSSPGRDQSSPLCSVSVNQPIKFSPPFPSPSSPPPLLSDCLCLCCFSAPLNPQSPSGQDGTWVVQRSWACPSLGRLHPHPAIQRKMWVPLCHFKDPPQISGMLWEIQKRVPWQEWG